MVVDRFLRVNTSPAASETIASMPMTSRSRLRDPILVAAFAVPLTVTANVQLAPAVLTPQLTRYVPAAPTVSVVFVPSSVTFDSVEVPSNTTSVVIREDLSEVAADTRVRPTRWIRRGPSDQWHPSDPPDRLNPLVRLDRSAPIGPVAPVGPVGPIGPVTPVGPVGPVVPVAPAGPAGPVGPVAPVEPLRPVAPGGPAAPAGPAARSPRSRPEVPEDPLVRLGPEPPDCPRIPTACRRTAAPVRSRTARDR